MKAPRIHNRVFFFFVPSRSFQIFISNSMNQLSIATRGEGGNENLENSEFRRGLIRRGAAVMARDAIK